MSLAEQKAFRAAIVKREFAPAYLLHGAEDFLKEEAVRVLIDGAVDAATRDFNLDVRNAASVDAGALGSLLNTPPMMAERRVVVLRDVGGIRKDAREILDRYLDRPAAETVLVMVAGAETKSDKALLQRSTAVEFDLLSENLIPKWIIQHADQTLHLEVLPAAATLLHEAIGADLAQLSVELEKLASFTSGNAVDEEAVSSIVGVRRGASVGDLLDAIARRQAAHALELLPIVLRQPKTSAVQIVMALTTQMLAIGWARAKRDRAPRAFRGSGDLFSLLKEARGPYTGRAWGEAVASWASAVEGWTVAESDKALTSLLAADRSLKDTRVSTDEQILSALILDLCTSSSHAAAA